MTYQELYEQIIRKRSYLCVGLDTDPNLLPKHLLEYENPVLEFNRQIIEATAPYCVAYKPNTAFYEAAGAKGWATLQQSLQHIPREHFAIADAKRGDIGNTSKLYARAFFEQMNFDAITVAPYMGADSVQPFLEFEGKWVILLALTSNSGSQDFQVLKYEEERLYERVLKTAKLWGDKEQLMFVVGATQTQELEKVREIAPKNFLLVPGVGTQGGSLEEVSKYGMNSHCGLLVNASRSIIYASDGEDFAEAAAREAKKLQEKMDHYLDKYLPPQT
ncbi:orotidine-5'-phosphate decarboxylase [Nafulsella turpanensis]|uniref:orotidine-5'-phosphate decarboxylase n=1 Tax=Nafulsella turpanensis TaxID=1265690 RepID=UPI00034CD9ED|nr:orotidine-5'-phosphate decarboxylase [Nafulsella turpanensis]